MIEFSRKTAMITGAAGNLGQAVARALHQAGAKTALVERSAEKLAAAFGEIKDSPDHYLAGGVDLTGDTSVREAVEKIAARLGRIDILIHTVGAFRGGKPSYEEDSADWDFLFQANVRTTLLVCRHVAPRMVQQRYGRIVTVGSEAALSGAPNFAAYSAAKTAVLRLTESLAGEVKAANVNVNCVLPGTMDTPANREAMPDADFSTWARLEDVASTMLFLASDAARAITGAAVPVRGKG